MLDYIIEDFEKSLTLGDSSIGGMVVCDSSKQAKEMYRIFNEKYSLNSKEQANVQQASKYKQNFKVKINSR